MQQSCACKTAMLRDVCKPQLRPRIIPNRPEADMRKLCDAGLPRQGAKHRTPSEQLVVLKECRKAINTELSDSNARQSSAA